MNRLKYEYILIFMGMSMILFTLRRSLKNNNFSPQRSQKFQTEESLGKMLQEINEFAEDMVGEIDDHSKNLKLLLNEATEKEKALHVLIDRTNAMVENIEEENVLNFEPCLPVFEKNLSSDHRYQAVYQLAQEGLDLPHIAKTLQMGQGEVKLILDLKDIQMKH